MKDSLRRRFDKKVNHRDLFEKDGSRLKNGYLKAASIISRKFQSGATKYIRESTDLLSSLVFSKLLAEEFQYGFTHTFRI